MDIADAPDSAPEEGIKTMQLKLQNKYSKNSY